MHSVVMCSVHIKKEFSQVWNEVSGVLSDADIVPGTLMTWAA